jgi:hypothetical protein
VTAIDESAIPRRFAGPAAIAARDGDVSLLSWPAQEQERAHLERERRARLLLLDRSCPPRIEWDPLEDWIREPFEPHELRLRVDRLARRAHAAGPRPRIDVEGFVRCGRSWIDVPPSLRPVARALVDDFERPVSSERLRAAYVGAGGAVSSHAMQAMIRRLRGRLAELDLAIVHLGTGCYLLEPAGAGERRRGRRAGDGPSDAADLDE